MLLLKNTKTILDLLGYKLVRFNNIWTIVDDKNNAVGSIKPIVVYGRVKYHFVIDSDTIHINYVHDDMFMLNFKDIGAIYFGRFDDPAFTFISEKYGNITFDLNYLNMYDASKFNREMALEFRYRQEENGCVVTEQSHIKNKNSSCGERKSYGYFKYKENPLNPDDTEYGKLLVETIDENPQNIHITVEDINHNLVYDKVEENVSIEEYAVKDGSGIELFKKLRKLINLVLPFKKDLIYELYKDKIDEYGLHMLFGEEKENKIK